MTLPSGTILGERYRVEQRLARGGFGDVYLVKHVKLDIALAAKVLSAPLIGDSKVTAQFEKEARIAAKLAGKHVVKVQDIGEDPVNGPFLIMELLEGRTLSDELKAQRDGCLPRGAVHTIFAQLGQALGQAHKQGVVHRDLTPANIFLACDDLGTNVVKLLDFGLAKLLDEQASPHLSRAMGTPSFAAPEQLCTDLGTVNTSTDVWALGLLAYFCLTGKHYWLTANSDSSAAGDVFKEVLTGPPVKASVRASKQGVADRLPPNFDPWFARCVNLVSALRFDEAKACIDELLLTLGASAPEARPSTPSPASMLTGQGFPSMPVVASMVPSSLPSKAPMAGATRTKTKAIALLAVGAGVGVGLARWVPLLLSPVQVPAPVVEPRWVRVRAVHPPVLLGVQGEAPASVRGFRPSRPVYSPSEDYELLTREVTVGMLGAWCARHQPRCNWTQPPALMPTSGDRARFPAVNVPWRLARDYCRDLGAGAELPTEAQWEFAARGASLRPFPWGSERLDTDRTHAFQGSEARLAMVGTHDQDRTPEGVFDLAGNAREWTLDLWHWDVPVDPGTEAWVQTATMTFRALRGLPLRGQFDPAVPVSAAHREAMCSSDGCPEGTNEVRSDVGFRCVRPVPSAPDGG